MIIGKLEKENRSDRTTKSGKISECSGERNLQVSWNIQSRYHQSQVWKKRWKRFWKTRKHWNHDLYQKFNKRNYDRSSLLCKFTRSFPKRFARRIQAHAYRTRKLMTMLKALFPRNDVDASYVKRKKRETNYCVDAVIYKIQEHSKKREGRERECNNSGEKLGKQITEV